MVEATAQRVPQGAPRGVRRVTTGLVAVAALTLAACSSGPATTTGAPTTATPGSTAAGSTGGGTTGGTSPGTTRAPLPTPAAYTSTVYADPAHWLCKPAIPHDVCDDDQTTTSVAADGTLTKVEHHKAADPGIDCFYVYPTISADNSLNSDLDAAPDSTEAGTTRNQAARLDSVCRVYAPVYRQVTLAGLFGRVQGDRAAAMATAYADVLDAWKQYLANDNHGRGVILIGHSQGAGHLTHLLKDEIDPKPEERARIVAAYLIGGSLAVPAGADVGGDLQHIPLCRAADQTGCAVAFSSFRSTAPPPANSLFGRPRSGSGVAACVNPAALTGGSAELHSEFPKTAPALQDPAADKAITTPYVTYPGMLTGECVQEGGYSYLKVTVHSSPNDKRVTDIGGDLTPEWGLHLVDVNLVMDDLVTLAGSQARAYLAG